MNKAHFKQPEAIVTGEWLEQHLDDPDLRIFDCSTYLELEEGTGRPYRVVSAEDDYNHGHIPGSVYLNLQEQFSDADSPFAFTMPPVEEVAETFARHGVSDQSRVILYSRKSLPWATRFWWMLRWLGFDNAAILDGGYDKWAADGREISTEPGGYPRGKLSVDPRPGIFVSKNVVLGAITDSGTCTINALGRDVHSGQNARYGRPGRIPQSVNVPAAGLFDPETLLLHSPETIANIFSNAGANPEKRTITYCGGGIFATLDAFLLHQLGYPDIAVYDRSMSEWATDESLPVETD